MKGYNTSEGYMGLVNGYYMLFASESEYREYVEEIYSERKKDIRAAVNKAAVLMSFFDVGSDVQLYRIDFSTIVEYNCSTIVEM